MDYCQSVICLTRMQIESASLYLTKQWNSFCQSLTSVSLVPCHVAVANLLQSQSLSMRP